MKTILAIFLLLVSGNANATRVWNGTWSGPATLGIPGKQCHFNPFTLHITATDTELSISNDASICLNDDGSTFTTWPNSPETFQINSGDLYSNGTKVGTISDTSMTLFTTTNQAAQTYNLNNGVITIHRVVLAAFAIDGVLSPTSP